MSDKLAAILLAQLTACRQHVRVSKDSSLHQEWTAFKWRDASYGQVARDENVHH